MNNVVEKWFDKLGDRIAEEGSRVRAVIAAGLAETVNGLRVTAARPQPILPNAVNGGRGRLVGWSLKAGAAGTVTLYAARAVDPQAVLAVIPLAAGAGDTKLPTGSGVSFGDGLYVDGPADVTGALYFGVVD